jgi:hypothetical protein
MKKIIKKATKKTPDEWIYKKKCRVCKCEYTYELSDVGIYLDEPSEYVVCPNCDYINNIFIHHKYKIKEVGGSNG